MKKQCFHLLVLAVMLIWNTPGFCENYINIAELHSQSESRWDKVYHTIREEDIKVDVEIMIPDALQFPCLEATYHNPSDLLPLTKNNSLPVYKGDFEYSNEQDGYFFFSIPGDSNKLKMEKKAKKQGIYRNMFVDSRVLQLSAGEFKLNTPYAVNNPSTINDATSLLYAYTEKFFPNQDIQWIPAFMQASIDTRTYEYNKETEEYEIMKDTPDFEGKLLVQYNQLIDGIPVLGWPYEGFSHLVEKRMKGEEMGTMGANVRLRTMKYLGSDDISFGMSLFLFSTPKILQKDVPLVPISSIISSAEDFILSGNLRRVDSLRLGYVAWRKGKSDFLLMPTWAIEGEVFTDANAEHQYPDDFYGHRNFAAEYQKLYINAQTGEIIDPWQTDNNRSYNAPPLITWKDVTK